MKLVIVTPLYPPEIGGPATYAKLIEERLPSEGVEVTMIKFADVRHFPKIVRHVALYRRILRAARDADVILALDPVSVGLAALWAAKKLQKKFVVKIVGDYAWEQGQQRYGILDTLDAFVIRTDVPVMVRILRKIQTGVARSADRIIVPSQYLKKIVTAWGVPAEKMSVIYNSIELPLIVLPEKRTEGFLVMSSGRRVPWKGFESLERVVKRGNGWHLVIASDLPREETLGWVQAANVFVLYSSYEGLSHALIEAMMLGTPIVATDVGGNGELIEHGVSGLLIPRDEEALLAALEEIERDPAAATERARVAKARTKEFSVEHMTTKTVALLKTI